MLDGDDRHQTISDVFSIVILFIIFQITKFSRVLIHNTGKCHFKSCDKGPTIGYIDSVTIRIDLFAERSGVLERHFHLDISAGSFDINNIFVQKRRIAVNITDVTLNSIFFQKCHRLSGMLVLKYNFEIFIQIRNFF